MKLNELQPTYGSKTAKRRVGRGTGSGLGKTSGYGHKGQKARSGSKKNGFEGGQMPLNRRLPKFGFKNISTKRYAVINLDVLDRFEEGAVVDSTLLIEKGYIKLELDGVKVLGNGKLTKKLTVKAAKASKSAKAAIEAVGGTLEVVK